jgi:hypothetical protein
MDARRTLVDRERHLMEKWMDRVPSNRVRREVVFATKPQLPRRANGRARGAAKPRSPVSWIGGDGACEHDGEQAGDPLFLRLK